MHSNHTRAKTRTYKELQQFDSYTERLEYLRVVDNYDVPRDVSDAFFRSNPWRTVREEVKKRDLGCDLGVPGLAIDGLIYVHHMNPITLKDILDGHPRLLDMNELISTSHETHMDIHYRSKPEAYVERKPGDTILW